MFVIIDSLGTLKSYLHKEIERERERERGEGIKVCWVHACCVLGVIEMCVQVRAESGQLGESSPALVTFVRFLARVASFMVV